MTSSLLAIDAVIARACGATVALILLIGAIDKLRDRELFEAIIDNYRLLPTGVVSGFARILPLAEFAAAALLLWPAARLLGAVLSTGLLALFSTAIAVNLLRGRRDVDCGCGGASGRQPLSWWLILRNAVLVLMTLAGASEGVLRDMAWLDAFTTIAATLALLALYAFFNQLGANAPRLQSLRRHA